MLEDILEMWRVHDEINLYLLRHIPDAGFAACTLLKTGLPSTGRNVARIFRHMHEARRSHVGREFLSGIPHFANDAVPGRAELIDAFLKCSQGIELRLAKIVAERTRGKARAGLVVLGALIAHDSHHRGQIVLALKQSAVKIPELVKFGIWMHWDRPEPGILQ